MKSLEGKVALISGGARGQGLTHALALAREGAKIVLTDLCEQIPSVPYPLSTEEDLALAAKTLEASGADVITVVADSRETGDVDDAVARAVSQFGSLDVVVVNHGIWTRSPLWELDDQMWRETIDVNLTGVFKVLRAASRQLIKQKSGSVVLTSSVNGIEGQSGSVHYTASKHGVLGLMRAAALELAPYGVRVNAVCPGFVDTAMTNWQGSYDFSGGRVGATREDHERSAYSWHAIGGLIKPEDISEAVVWLASDQARRVTGVALPVDAGHLLLPGVNSNPDFSL